MRERINSFVESPLMDPFASFYHKPCPYWGAEPTAVYSVCGKVTPPWMNVNGTALLAATCGTTRLIWYSPTDPGDNPWYAGVTAVVPNITWTGTVSVVS